MFGLTEKDVKNLQFTQDRGHLGYCLFHEDNKTILKGVSHICFGRLSDGVWFNFKQRPEAKYLKIYFPDSLYEVIKNFSERNKRPDVVAESNAEKFLKILSDSGFDRDGVSYEITTAQEMPQEAGGVSPYSSQVAGRYYKETPMIVMTVDIDKVSSREIFFIGGFVRIFLNGPAWLYDLFDIMEKFPNKPVWELLYLTNVLTLRPGVKKQGSHVPICSQYFKAIKKSPAQWFKDFKLETWGTWRENGSYIRTKSGTDKQMTNSYLHEDTVNYPGYLFRSDYPAHDVFIYTEEKHDSYLSLKAREEYLKKNPYPQLQRKDNW